MSEIFLIYIAVVVAFFLLGIIIGYIINPRKKLKKQKEKPLSETVKEDSEELKDLGQDMNGNDPNQYQSEQRFSRYNNYNNYGNSYYGNNSRNRPRPR